MTSTKPTKGYKTTEFWLAALTAVATLLNQSGILGSVQLPMESVVMIGGLAISYIFGRSIVKKDV